MQAAADLAASSAKPILEDSPSLDHPGGLHLMLVFDSLVDVTSSQATAHHWAPELKKVKETWPNGGARVRLPAGRYRRKGVDAWCAVWEVGGLKQTQGAALELLRTRQTSASWVTITLPASPSPRQRRAARSDTGWLPPARQISKGDGDTSLTRFAAAMAGKAGMSESEIVDELMRIRDECCEYVPGQAITDASLVSKARSAVQKFRGGRGLSGGDHCLSSSTAAIVIGR